MLLVANY